MTVYALLIRELMKPTRHACISIPREEGDGQVETRIYIEAGGDLDENYNHDFIMNHFAMADLMLKAVISTAKPHGLEELERASRLAIGMNEIEKKTWDGCEWSRRMKRFFWDGCEWSWIMKLFV